MLLSICQVLRKKHDTFQNQNNNALLWCLSPQDEQQPLKNHGSSWYLLASTILHSSKQFDTCFEYSMIKGMHTTLWWHNWKSHIIFAAICNQSSRRRRYSTSTSFVNGITHWSYSFESTVGSTLHSLSLAVTCCLPALTSKVTSCPKVLAFFSTLYLTFSSTALNVSRSIRELLSFACISGL